MPDPVRQLNTREAVIDLPRRWRSPPSPVGTLVDIWLESDEGTRSPGSVSRIEPLADAATRTRRLHLSMDNPTDFRLGALIRAQHGGPRANFLTLPEVAIGGTKDAPSVGSSPATARQRRSRCGRSRWACG